MQVTLQLFIHIFRSLKRYKFWLSRHIPLYIFHNCEFCHLAHYMPLWFYIFAQLLFKHIPSLSPFTGMPCVVDSSRTLFTDKTHHGDKNASQYLEASIYIYHPDIFLVKYMSLVTANDVQTNIDTIHVHIYIILSIYTESYTIQLFWDAFNIL